MTQLTDKGHWAVEVPDDAQELDISHGRLIWVTNDSVGYETMTEGSWQYLFTTKEVTEEQAAIVVQLISSGRISGRPQYRRYDRDLVKDMPAKCWTRDSRHSLETLLKSKGCDDKKNWAIILKQTSNG